jgi:small subunit ribosomal protein S21
MLHIEVDNKKQGALEKALKKFKAKFKATKTVEELRERQSFTKKSVKRREQFLKAKYKQSQIKND